MKRFVYQFLLIIVFLCTQESLVYSEESDFYNSKTVSHTVFSYQDLSQDNSVQSEEDADEESNIDLHFTLNPLNKTNQKILTRFKIRNEYINYLQLAAEISPRAPPIH
ncbi:MAG: hypothetical protein PQJ61_03455 [Spirochaetales bacterium]|uniref:Uncharacterized protein n=1 Tax=Candidatus Thalassospirochaeta sargassi TaxID=3119039 RepID=A0AAJ1IAQ1_9SPIO|nr:hypothetical protein [Spirochaetales bacterium]